MPVTPPIRVDGKLPRPDGTEPDSQYALGSTVALTVASTAGIQALHWEISEKPAGSSAVLGASDPLDPFNTTLGPLDFPGTYLVKATANGIANWVKEVAITVLTPTRNMRIPARAEKGQWDGSDWWWKALRDLILAADSFYGSGALYSVTTSSFVMPAVGANVTVPVNDSAWMGLDQVTFMETARYMRVVSKPSGTSVTLKNLGYDGNAAPGATIPTTRRVAPGGEIGPSLTDTVVNATTTQTLTNVRKQFVVVSPGVTVTMPPAPTDGDMVMFKAIGTATISANAGQLLEDASGGAPVATGPITEGLGAIMRWVAAAGVWCIVASTAGGGGGGGGGSTTVTIVNGDDDVVVLSPARDQIVYFVEPVDDTGASLPACSLSQNGDTVTVVIIKNNPERDDQFVHIDRASATSDTINYSATAHYMHREGGSAIFRCDKANARWMLVASHRQDEEVVDPTFYTPQMFGAAADGVTDDTRAYRACMAAAVAAGMPMVIPGGGQTYLISSRLRCPSNLKVKIGSGGARIKTTIAYDVADPYNTLFCAQPEANGGTTTLSSAVVENDITISTAASIPGSTWIAIQALVAGDVNQNYFKTGAPSGSGPYAIPLDIPCRAPFASGCTVRRYDAGMLSVRSEGTAPPVITLTGTPSASVIAIEVECTGAGARGVWTGRWRLNGGSPTLNGGGWTSFTSAATVALSGTGLTLNIAVGTASTNNVWDSLYSDGFPHDIDLDLTGLTVSGTGSRFYEFVGDSITVRGLKVDTLHGHLGIGGVCGSFDIGSRNCHASNCSADCSAAVKTVTSAGTAPPVITITGNSTGTFSKIKVRTTLGGARGTWTGEWSKDSGANWTAFTSAATVAMTGTGLTLNIAIGTANINNTWESGIGGGWLLENAWKSSLTEMIAVGCTEGTGLYDCVDSHIVKPQNSGNTYGCSAHTNGTGTRNCSIVGAINIKNQIGAVLAAGDNSCTYGDDSDCSNNEVVGVKIASPNGGWNLRGKIRAFTCGTPMSVESGSKPVRAAGAVVFLGKATVGRDLDLNVDVCGGRWYLTQGAATTTSLRIFAGTFTPDDFELDGSAGGGVTNLWIDGVFAPKRWKLQGAGGVHGVYVSGAGAKAFLNQGTSGAVGNDVTVAASGYARVTDSQLANFGGTFSVTGTFLTVMMEVAAAPAYPASAGSSAYRISGGGAGTTFYMRETGATTNWTGK